MSKPVTGLTQWGSVTTGSTQALDDNFTALKAAANDLNTYSNYLVDTGAANAYVVTLGANLTATLSAGLKVSIKITNANTGASTLNFNAGGVVAIQNPDGSALGAGQLAANGVYDFIYSGSVWFLQTPIANRGWTLLATKSANANTTIDFNNTLSSSYDQFVVTLSDVRVETADVGFQIRVGNGNTPTYQATSYVYSARQQNSNGGVDRGSTKDGLTTAIQMTGVSGGGAGVGNSANKTLAGQVVVMNPAAGRLSHVQFTCEFVNESAGDNPQFVTGSGYWNTPGALTSIQFRASSGNISAGNFAVYGIVKS